MLGRRLWLATSDRHHHPLVLAPGRGGLEAEIARPCASRIPALRHNGL